MTQKEVDDFLLILRDNPSIIQTVNNVQFLSLLSIKNPDLLEHLTDQQVEALNRHIDPYSSIKTKDNKDKFLLFSYTNYKSETLARMNMLATTAFLFQAVNEYGLNPEDFYNKPMPEMEEKRAVIREFLTHLFKYDPNKHIQSCYSEFVNQEINSPNEKYMIPEALKPAIENILPEDLFSSYDRFYRKYFNEVYGLSHKIWGLSEQIDFKINPYFCGTITEIEDFEKKYSGDIRVKTSVARMGHYTCVGPFRQNDKNCTYAVQSDPTAPDINKLMKVGDYEKIRNAITKKKVQASQKKQGFTPEDEEAIERYKNSMGVQDMIDALDDAEEEANEIQYKVIVHDVASGQTTVKNLNTEEFVHT